MLTGMTGSTIFIVYSSGSSEPVVPHHLIALRFPFTLHVVLQNTLWITCCHWGEIFGTSFAILGMQT